ncbi:hypothetical protein SAMN04488023_11884 [Pedobacter rhizosphaerae]|uniref:Uncharacterized protein n=1 Tax=Pedobacter rhizosphaerae TaxID=390241 RepID=A0A1H9SL96_9SPHI|nr:hypothetical protein SAMN04488023_11884 [Pedobacter rhizosphaerae]
MDHFKKKCSARLFTPFKIGRVMYLDGQCFNDKCHRQAVLMQRNFDYQIKKKIIKLKF